MPARQPTHKRLPKALWTGYRSAHQPPVKTPSQSERVEVTGRMEHLARPHGDPDGQVISRILPSRRRMSRGTQTVWRPSAVEGLATIDASSRMWSLREQTLPQQSRL